jgi:prophage tail gpP-like protein
MVVRIVDQPDQPSFDQRAGSMFDTSTPKPGQSAPDTPAPWVDSRFPPTEIAILEVNGQLFTDWEQIWLQFRWTEAFAYFRFIAAERMPTPADWKLLQFKPGDSCTVWLAGQRALTGIITDRQVSYDANRHQVQLIGKTWSRWGYKSSVDTPTGSFDGKTLSQVYTEVMGVYPGEAKIIGVVNPIPFTKLQNEVGELTWDFLERISRPRGAVLGSDQFGNYLLIGDHEYRVSAVLKEGENIKACECVISHDFFHQIFESRGQTAGDDEQSGAAANELKCILAGQPTLYSKLITQLDHPVKTTAEVCDHAHNVAKWHAGTEITANIVVYGWTYDGVHLWECGQNVYVDSPMAMLNMTLKIRTATFEQNNSVGTQTTLELVAPWMLNDRRVFGEPDAPVAPAPSPEGTPPPNLEE